MKTKISLGFVALVACCLSAGPVGGDTSTGNTVYPDLDALELAVTRLESSADKLQLTALPTGTVMGWAGSIFDVPDGWGLCDGQDGRPDLRDRFIVGAETPEQIGEIGGTRSHDHGRVPHDHVIRLRNHYHEIAPWTGETSAAGAHTHQLGESTGGGIGVDVGEEGAGLGRSSIRLAPVPHTHETSLSAPHRHLLSILRRVTGLAESFAPTATASPESLEAVHLPPYYKLAFVVKLPQPPSPPVLEMSQEAQLPQIETLALDVDALDAVMGSLVEDGAPIALIVGWNGTAESVPDGWELCDGSDDTPDLRGRFVLGARHDEEIGKTGGQSSHAHTLEEHRHTATMPRHRHLIARWSGSTDFVGQHTHEVHPGIGVRVDGERFKPDAYAADPDHTHSISEAGRHAHGVVLPERYTSYAGRLEARTESGSDDVAERPHLPPYYKLAYIRRLPYVGPAATGLGDAAGLTTEARIAALEERIGNLKELQMVAEAYLVPPHAIGIWAGSIDDLPSGWALCDGLNGTPDLRKRFVVGAVLGAGEEGGEPNHFHVLRAHAHEVDFTHGHALREKVLATETRNNTGHRHSTATMNPEPIEGDPIGAGMVRVSGGVGGLDILHEHLQPMYSYENQHEHTVTLDDNRIPRTPSLSAVSSSVTGRTTPASNLPPYCRLVFAMKLVGGD